MATEKDMNIFSYCKKSSNISEDRIKESNERFKKELLGYRYETKSRVKEINTTTKEDGNIFSYYKKSANISKDRIKESNERFKERLLTDRR